MSIRLVVMENSSIPWAGYEFMTQCAFHDDRDWRRDYVQCQLELHSANRMFIVRRDNCVVRRPHSSMSEEHLMGQSTSPSVCRVCHVNLATRMSRDHCWNTLLQQRNRDHCWNILLQQRYQKSFLGQIVTTMETEVPIG